MATATLEAPVPTRVTDDHEHYEVVGGVRMEPPRMGTYETIVANILSGYLGPFVRDNGLGRCLVEMLFRIDVDDDLQRRPDLAVVTYDRWPKARLASPNDAWNVVPDLAVEVVSPSSTAASILEKLREYFRCGVRLSWVVFPSTREVYVYTSTTAIQVLQAGEALDGGEVAPGFMLPLSTLFGDDEPEAAP